MTAVFLHGTLETCRLWDRLRAHLDTDSVALALPGFGNPRPSRFAATKDDYAAWLAQSLGHIDGPIDLVGHDWGALLVVRVATAFDVPLRSWTADTARALHPDYVWNRLARTFQTAGAGDEWMAAAGHAHPESSESAASRLALLGVPWDDAVAMGAALNETMGGCILDLYRSALPNVSADWGAELGAPTRAPGLVLIASADPLNDEDAARDVARRLGAQTHRFDGLGHAWMAEDPAQAGTVLQRFWSSIQ
jgi:pimeloyl-ACP methyl ester carboxylesterase